MSIELDWQIVAEDVSPEEPSPLPPPKPRRRLPRRLLLAAALIVILLAAAFAGYYAWTYRARLVQVTEPVRSVAQMEAQAIEANDRVSFLALQDPNDSAWRNMQEKRFGRLENLGLPEFGWQATGVQPSLGGVTLEPGGARLDVTYHFSVMEPMPNGPVSVTLELPQYYKQTPSGWVHAMPGMDYWGRWRTQSGKRFAMQYLPPDADVLEPLIPRMDALLERMCSSLRCPAQPVYAIFGNSAETLSRLSNFSAGFDSGFILRLPSPHLFGLPADAASREELYRAIETRVVQALVYETSGRLDSDSAASLALVRWELARAGLTGPFITPAITQTLAAGWPLGARQSLSSLSLSSRPAGRNAALMPLALAFIEEQFGADSVARLAPALGWNPTLGEAIRQALHVNSRTLESAWRDYLQRQVNSARARPPTAGLPVLPPQGELAVGCMSDTMSGAIFWRINTDGIEQALPISSVETIPIVSWSPDGNRLAFMQPDAVAVMEAASQQTRTIQVRGWPRWLPDGRLVVSDFFDEGPSDQAPTYVANLDTGEVAAINGVYPTWSPDGTQVAYFTGETPIIWVADANGRNARQMAEGGLPAWSPDGKRLAFLSGLRFEPVGNYTQTIPTEIQVIDLASGLVKTLARQDDLTSVDSPDRGSLGSLAWSPDGRLLAVGMQRQQETSFVVLNADTGAVRAFGRGTLFPLPLAFIRSWSPDSRYLVLWDMSDSPSEDGQGELEILDMNTGQVRALSSVGLWDWSPDGKWLAVAQMEGEGGVWLVTPDLMATRHLLEGVNCISVAWRPRH